ncbi:MAG TPA: SDR family NAD(P)-dependent oxidoreductase [Candidatus Polarisedimenticolia bacterium]|jgi:NAD(P)-dependent dehydrogenase (short-subunit alcohol dehydrogenase family)|nr:SDR family NAD(P)-dependent oxidoreductase [Candidatus Polarisedimenticolia bacterium]
MIDIGALHGKVAVVTGGTRGIGRAVSLRLARAGAHLLLAGRTEARVREAVEQARAVAAPGTAIDGLAIDVTQEADAERLAAAALGRHGRIDILVACAGALRAAGAPPRAVHALPSSEWDPVVDLNLVGLFLTNRAVLQAMIRQGSGDILNLSSRSGREAVALDAPYCASKFAVVGLTESLQEEARAHGIRVQAVLPGAFDSDVWDQNGALPRPADLPPASRVADLIVAMLAMPADTCLQPVVIEPLRRAAKLLAREGAGAGAPESVAGAETAAGPDLAGRVVLVTGGASGIGRAAGRAAAARGASCVLADRDGARLAAEVDALAAHGPGPHLGVPCDVSVEDEVRALVGRTLERFGRLDALVHCAGILRGHGGVPRPVASLSAVEFRQVIDVNLRGTFLVNRAVLPHFMEQRRGTILNLSSLSGLHGRAHDAAYCASKFGVAGLTGTVRAEAERYGVRVAAIFPDVVDTPLWDQNGPVPRPGDALPPERVADLIVFMLEQPDDTVLTGPVIAPLRARRRRAAAVPVAAGAGQEKSPWP